MTDLCILSLSLVRDAEFAAISPSDSNSHSSEEHRRCANSTGSYHHGGASPRRALPVSVQQQASQAAEELWPDEQQPAVQQAGRPGLSEAPGGRAEPRDQAKQEAGPQGDLRRRLKGVQWDSLTCHFQRPSWLLVVGKQGGYWPADKAQVNGVLRPSPQIRI